MAWPGDQVQQMGIANLSLNTPQRLTLLEGNVPLKNNKQREREGERERAPSELDAK